MRTILIVATMLGGCASTASIYASGIDETTVSDKALTDVSRCLQLKYDTVPLETADGELTFALKNMQRVTLGTLSLRQSEDQTVVEMRRSKTIGALGNWKSCL